MKPDDETCRQELSYDDDTGEITAGDGRVFRPLYKHLLDNMPRDLVQEMARRRLAELDAAIKARERGNRENGEH